MAERAYECDVLVIGAGPAGALAGHLLARRGRSVQCVERGRFPRHAIGESLLPRCNHLLRKAGLLDAVAARGYTVKTGATFLRGDRAERFVFAEGLAGDEATAFQVPRDDFDRTLADEAARAGVTLRFDCRVDGIDLRPDGVEATTTDVETGERARYRARLVLDGSGAGLVVPRHLGLVERSPLASRVACYAHVEHDRRPKDDTAGDIWICVHPEHGWIWIIPFSNGRTSVGVVCDRSSWDGLAGDDDARLRRLVDGEPNAARRLRDATPVGPTRTVADYSVDVGALHGPGWALVGNAGGFLDPVFSSGVTLALESATLAAGLTDRELSGGAVDWSAEYEAPIRGANDVFRAFVESWYEGEFEALAFAETPLPRIKRFMTSILGGQVARDDNPLLPDPRPELRRLHAALGAGHA